MSGDRSKTCNRVDHNHLKLLIMKTIFARRFMAPLAVMILGGAGAFVTTSMKSAEVKATVPGYRYVSQADPCHEDIQCSATYKPTLCSSGSAILKGFDGVSCNMPLYKK